MKASRFSPVVTLPLVFLLALSALSLYAEGSPQTVYRTAKGQKYHLSGCSALRRSKIPISLEEAAKSGYEPCSLCRPPVTDIPSNLYRVNKAGIQNSAAAETRLMLKAVVTDTVDGDTIRVRIENPPGSIYIEETIRFLGVDTPETVRPNTPPQRFGKEASDFTRKNLSGRSVYLALDWDLRDRYGRLLAYVYTAQGQCFNAALIREGCAFAYLRHPFQFIDEFRALEQEARREKRGLWGK